MNKIIIFIIAIMLCVPMVFADTFISAPVTTDFSRPFVQDKCYSEGDGDCFTRSSYSLRSLADSEVTGINYTDAAFGFCSVSNGGSVLRGVPLSYYDDTGYKHFSYLAAKGSSVKQVNPDCSIADTYTVEGTIISQIGLINAGEIAGNVTLPYIAFLYNATADSNVYIQILTLNSITSKLQAIADFYVGNATAWGDTLDIIGVAGGCITANVNSCSIDDMVFGAFTRHTDDLFVAFGKDNFDIESVYNDTTSLDESKTRQLYFDDFDADGINEFILIGAYTTAVPGTFIFELNRFTVATDSPYITEQARKSLTINGGAGGSCAYDSNIYDGDITLCQVGGVNSALEVCYTSYTYRTACVGDSSTIKYITGFIYNDFDDIANIAISDYFPHGTEYFIKPFTIGDIEKYFCSSSVAGFGMIECIDEELNSIMTFNLSDTTVISEEGTSYGSNFIVANIDDNASTYEMVFTDGSVQTIVQNGNTTLRDDWADSHSSIEAYNKGYIYIQDISGDGISEIIYTDDTRLQIFSMNDSLYGFKSAYSFLSATTTTTVAGTTTTTILNHNPNVPDVITGMQNNINIIFALLLTIGLCIMVATRTRSTIVIVFAGIIGVVISSAIGLIDASVLVILIIVLVILMIMGLTLFRNTG
jgi:hypothetical protein